jgi:hypothetical protein
MFLLICILPLCIAAIGASGLFVVGGLRSLRRAPLPGAPGQLWRDPSKLTGLTFISWGISLLLFIASYFAEYYADLSSQFWALTAISLSILMLLGGMVVSFRSQQLERSAQVPMTQGRPPHDA